MMTHSESPSNLDPVDRLAESFLERLRRGEHPGIDEYVEAHPELADRIRELFPALIAIERLKFSDGVDLERPPAGQHSLGTSTPTVLGDFRILREIGRGGMGVVFEAVQQSLGRHVALKVLPPEFCSRPNFLERFRREARSAARLHHTNIVPVFGVGEHEGHHYYAMQFIRGQTLESVMDEARRLRRELEGVSPAAAATRKPATGDEASIALGLLTNRFIVRSRADDPETMAATLALEPEIDPGVKPPRHLFRRRIEVGPPSIRFPDVAISPIIGLSRRLVFRLPRHLPTPTIRASSTGTSSLRTCSWNWRGMFGWPTSDSPN